MAAPAILLSMPKGAARAVAARALARVGRVATTSDRYDAAARFASEGAALVVVSLRRWRRADLAFVTAVRARSRRTGILLLVPDGRRSLAIDALRRGADAYVLDPFDPEELRAVASRLVRRPGARRRSGGEVERLVGQVAHAVNNPLQAMSLLVEEAAEREGADAGFLDRLRAEVDRVRDAMDVLSAYGQLPKPASAPLDLGAVLRERAETAAGAGLVRAVPAKRSPRSIAVADAALVRRALDAILRFLATRSEERPLPVRFAVRRGGRPGSRFVEAAVRASGVRLTRRDWAEALESVLLTDERTRRPHPGLALPRAIARAHGGRLRLRDTDRGAVVGILLPRAD